MTHTDNIHIFVQLQNLSTTISQNIRALIDYPENMELCKDIQENIQTIKTNLATLGVSAEELLSLWCQTEKLLPNLSGAGATQTAEIFNTLLNTHSLIITQFLRDAIKKEDYLEYPVAQTLFSYFEQSPHTHISIYQLMLDVCLKSGFSAPMEAFKCFMQLFEEQPNLLSGESTIHPGYIYHSSEQHTFDTCPICNSQKRSPYYCSLSYTMKNFEPPFLPAKLWMKCETCGNLYTWKFPKKFLDLSNQSKTIIPDKSKYLSSTVVTSGATLSIWSNILNQLQSYTNKKKNTLLDVGVGHGELLAVALEMGYDVDAVEIVPEAAQKVADTLAIPVWNGDFLQYRTDKTYSTIIMGDVIEHVTNPELALRQAYELLNDDGVLWLSTPNFESSFSKLQKFNDPMWCEPYHISYFCRRSFEALAQKCGFIIKEYSVSNRYNGSMEIILIKQ